MHHKGGGGGGEAASAVCSTVTGQCSEVGRSFKTSFLHCALAPSVLLHNSFQNEHERYPEIRWVSSHPSPKHISST